MELATRSFIRPSTQVITAAFNNFHYRFVTETAYREVPLQNQNVDTVGIPRPRGELGMTTEKRLQRKIQSHLLIRQHDVGFGDHAQQLLFVAAGDNREIGQMEFAHALDDLMHGLVWEGVLDVA